jgi:hypothetical protein
MSEDSGAGVPVNRDPRQCVHGVAMDDFCYHCGEIEMEEEYEAAELHDEDKEKAEILLKDAMLTGKERDDLESLLEDDEFGRIHRDRFQEICNSHISVIHAAQRQ